MSQRKRQKETDELISAAMAADESLLARLLPKVKDINGANIDGLTALMAAASLGRAANVITLLLANGARVNQAIAQTNGVWGGKTALMFAAQYGHGEILQRLIAAGADIDAQTNEGETALMVAAFHGEKEVAEILLAARANMRLRNQDNETAHDVAIKMGQVTVAQLLENQK